VADENQKIKVNTMLETAHVEQMFHYIIPQNQ
jgi:hypothetical protein